MEGAAVNATAAYTAATTALATDTAAYTLVPVTVDAANALGAGACATAPAHAIDAGEAACAGSACEGCDVRGGRADTATPRGGTRGDAKSGERGRGGPAAEGDGGE